MVACSEEIISSFIIKFLAYELKPLVVWYPLLVLPQLPIRHVVNVLHRLARRFGNLFQRTLRLQFRNYFWFDKVRLYFFVLYPISIIVVTIWSRLSLLFLSTFLSLTVGSPPGMIGRCAGGRFFHSLQYA